MKYLRRYQSILRGVWHAVLGGNLRSCQKAINNEVPLSITSFNPTSTPAAHIIWGNILGVSKFTCLSLLRLKIPPNDLRCSNCPLYWHFIGLFKPIFAQTAQRQTLQTVQNLSAVCAAPERFIQDDSKCAAFFYCIMHFACETYNNNKKESL